MKIKKPLKYYHDVNFEWLASYLHKQLDYDLFAMMIQPIGIFRRHINHDVENVERLSVNGVDTLKFELNRDGMYDNLPHGLFHKTNTTDTINQDSDKLLQSIKKENKKEEDARSFFLVFESELLLSNVVNRLFTLDAERKDFGFAYLQILKLLPFDTSIFTKKELINAIQLFPFANQSEGNIKQKIERSIEFVLDVDTTIHLSSKLSIKKTEMNDHFTLGITQLGWNFCLGSESHQIESICKIKVVDHHENIDVLGQKMKTICEWIAPLYYQIEIEYQQDNEAYFILGDENSIIN